MIKFLAGVVGLSIAFAPVVASAQAIKEKDLLSGKTKIESESGYIFINGPSQQFGTLVRVPDAEMISAYESDWSSELAKAQKEYQTKLSLWMSDNKKALDQRRSVPPKPVEPTAENFLIDPIEFREPVSYGPGSLFTKKSTPVSYSYLMKVKPGRYALYGRISTEFTGVCYCMGTVSFDVKPGLITDVGTSFFFGLGDFPNLYVPASLRSYRRAKVEFRAHGKLDNVYGVIVDRLPPVAGVLAYDRDKVIDLKAAAEAPAAPAATQVDTVGGTATP